MHAMKLRVQAMRAALAHGTCGALPLVGQRHNNVGVSLTAGKASHNASNARGVTAGKMGRNSSIQIMLKSEYSNRLPSFKFQCLGLSAKT